jgi:hypothetical protein
VRLDLLLDVIAPRITHRDVERELRKMMRTDPMRAERAVGQMYGHAFRKAEESYAERGSLGRQDWSGVRVG